MNADADIIKEVSNSSGESVVDSMLVKQPNIPLSRTQVEEIQGKVNYTRDTSLLEDSDSDPSDPQEDSDIYGSDAGPGICSVVFTYTETDGTVRVFNTAANKSYEYGTPYSSIEVPASSSFPYRESGYWTFTGWSEDFSDSTQTLTSDVVSEAVFIPFAGMMIEFDWNGATPYTNANIIKDENEDKWYLKSTWGSLYPTLSPIPQKNNSQFGGAFLKTDPSKVIGRTHGADGKSVTTTSSTYLGSGTFDSSVTSYTISACKIQVVWNTPIEWNTLQNIRDAIDTLPCPFGAGSGALATYPAVSPASGDISFAQGFPPAYTKPLIKSNGEVDQTARVISRKDVNALGYYGTQEQFFAQCGGYYTFDQSICDAIGGYPQTAILRYFDSAINCLRTVYSLVDNNTWNFIENGVDGVHWKYIDDNPALTLRVEYSDFVDLRDVLFVETGLADFYEVPYDGVLQMHALSFCDMHSTLRDYDEYVYMYTGVAWNPDIGEYEEVYENLQGAFATKFLGNVYLDVWDTKTNTTNSILIRNDGSLITQASDWIVNIAFGAYYQYKLPRYVVTQGSVFLNKGSKIRVRGVYEEIMNDEKFGDSSRVYPRVLSDMEVRRFYLCKFANFYRVGWEA